MTTSTKKDINISSQTAETPYMAARREWNERYGDYIASAHNWRMTAFFLALACLVLAGGMVYISTQARFTPYIVEVDNLGRVSHVATAEKITHDNPRVVKAMLTSFIINWRSVSPDTVIQKTATDRLYKFVPQGSPTLQKINSFYQDNSPYVLAQSMTVAIEPIGTPLPLSDQSWQVEWWETKRNLAGAVMGRTRYKAVLQVKFSTPKDQNQALDLDNPIGLYVTDIDWSQQIS